jgi:hypothetical protein
MQGTLSPSMHPVWSLDFLQLEQAHVLYLQKTIGPVGLNLEVFVNHIVRVDLQDRCKCAAIRTPGYGGHLGSGNPL